MNVKLILKIYIYSIMGWPNAKGQEEEWGLNVQLGMLGL